MRSALQLVQLLGCKEHVRQEERQARQAATPTSTYPVTQTHVLAEEMMRWLVTESQAVQFVAEPQQAAQEDEQGWHMSKPES